MPAITITFQTYPHLAYFLNAFSSTYQHWSITITHPDLINADIQLYESLTPNVLEAIHKLAAASGMVSMEVSTPDNRIQTND